MSLEEIIKKIETDYAEREKQLREKAQSDYLEKLETARKKLQAKFENDREHADTELKAKYGRMYMSRNSALKLEINKFKSDHIERIFDDLHGYISGLSEKEYSGIYLHFADDPAIKNITRCRLGKKEGKLGKEFFLALKKKTGAEIKDTEKAEDFDLGIVLSGKDFDINLSLEEIVKKVREARFTEIVKKIFNE